MENHRLIKKQATLLPLRDSIVELIKRGNVPSSTLCSLGFEIGWALVACERREDAYQLSRQVTELLERRLAKDPDDQKAQDAFRSSLDTTGVFAQNADRFADAFDCFERFTAISWGSASSADIAHDLMELHTGLSELSGRLQFRGPARIQERARRATEQIRVQLFGSDIRFDPSPRFEGTTLASKPPLTEISTLRALLTGQDPSERQRVERGFYHVG